MKTAASTPITTGAEPPSEKPPPEGRRAVQALASSEAFERVSATTTIMYCPAAMPAGSYFQV